MGTTSDDGSDGGVDGRQVALIALCLVGLVTASFLAPVTGSNPPVGGDGGLLADIVSEIAEFLTDNNEQPDSEEGQPSGGGEGGGEGTGDGTLPEWLIELLRNLIGDGEDTGGGGGESGESGCLVLVESNPSPGSETTVRVLQDGDPQSGVPVWFNDQYVGETDDSGQVTGEVPYVDQLNVTVQTEGSCRFERRSLVSALGGGAVSAAPVAGVAGPLGASIPTDDPLGQRLDSDVAAQASDDEGVNSSGEVSVNGRATVELVGEPYPNATITVFARSGNVPIPEANVSVDGERVGQTDATGRYALRVPDRDSFRLTVSRGPVTGSTTIQVWQLQIAFVPQFAVPGETVTANVSTPDGPVSNAALTLEERRLGETGPNGTVQFRAPASVDGTLRATTSRQTSSVPVWRVYALTAGVSALLVVLSTVSTAIVARRSGRKRAKRVAIGWLAVGTLFVGFAVWELPGVLAALGLFVLVWLATNWRTVHDGGLSAVASSVRLLARTQRLVLAVVSWLETLVDLLRAYTVQFVGWLRTLPTSLSGLAERLRRWLGVLPARIRESVQSLSRRQLGAVVLACLFVVAATVVFGAPGFVVSVGLVVVAAVFWKVNQHVQIGDTPTPSASETEQAESGHSHDDVAGRPTLRELWRWLARVVLPDEWRTKTPGEISRAAIDAGFPSEPVERLTEAFRDVEYGGHPEATRIADAWEAYESLEEREEER